MRRAWIQPTGDELLSGVVLDTNSPMIAALLSRIGFQSEVAPLLPDREDELRKTILRARDEGFSCMILIGGSGEGHRYDETLGRDVTHAVLGDLLPDASVTELYGKNGHLWSRLLCGFLGDMLLCNVPGPPAEARAATEAFVRVYDAERPDPALLNRAMAEAVQATYHTGTQNLFRTGSSPR